MLAVPSITPSIVVREGSLQALQRQICRAHNRLPHVIETVNHVPMVILRQLDVALQTGVYFDNSVQAVKLMCHGGREDGLVLIPHDGGGQVVVQLRPFDVLEAHADGDQLIPSLESFGLEEVGGIVGCECLVDCEGCDLGGDCMVSVYVRLVRAHEETYCGAPSRSCRRRLLSHLLWRLLSTLSP